LHLDLFEQPAQERSWVSGKDNRDSDDRNGRGVEQLSLSLSDVVSTLAKAGRRMD
jgi:hypothetical protein